MRKSRSLGPAARQSDSGAERSVRSSPLSVFIKLAIVVVVGWGSYLCFLVGSGRLLLRTTDKYSDGNSNNNFGGNIHVQNGIAGDGPQHHDRRPEHAHEKRYRHLNMLGFERGDGKEGGAKRGWKTCKAYKEAKLSPQRKVPGVFGYRKKKLKHGTECAVCGKPGRRNILSTVSVVGVYRSAKTNNEMPFNDSVLCTACFIPFRFV